MRQAAARRAASSASAPSRTPPRTTSRRHAEQPLAKRAEDDRAGEQRACSLRVEPEGELDDLLRGRVGEHVDRLVELVGAELRLLRAAGGRGRCHRRRAPSRIGGGANGASVPVDLARAPAGPLRRPGGSSSSMRLVSRFEPRSIDWVKRGPVATGADDDLRRPAADVDHGDDAPRRRRRHLDRADERQPAFFGRAQDARRAPGGRCQRRREDRRRSRPGGPGS